MHGMQPCILPLLGDASLVHAHAEQRLPRVLPLLLGLLSDAGPASCPCCEMLSALHVA